ncbi:MAG: ABC transporter substrate-binding protein [Spirochaeta sp.]
MNALYRNILPIVFLLTVFTAPAFSAGQREVSPDPAAETAPPAEIRMGGLRGPTSVALSPYIADPTRLGEDYIIRTETYATPDLAISQIMSGQVDIAALPTNLASILYNRNSSVSMLGASGGGVLYVVADREMELEDIAGHTVHTIARGATPDIMLRTLANETGLQEGLDYHIQYASDQTELAQNLVAGRVTLAVLPEPFVTRVTQANSQLKIAVDLQELYTRHYGMEYYPMTAIVVRSEFARSNPEAVQEWLQDMPQAQQWLRDNLPEAAEAAGETIGIPADIIQAAFPRLNLTWIPAQEARAEVETYLQIFADFNPESIGGSLPGDSFFYPLDGE